MNEINPDKLLALRQLADSTRELINQMMSFDAPIEDIEEITTVISELNEAMKSYPQGRMLGHYDLSVARSDSNHTLPYSPVMGPYNPIAAPVDMHYDESNECVIGTVTFGKAYEGPEGMVHGSIVAAVYDQLLALASACSGKPSYTAYLNTIFKKPTPLYCELVFTGWIDNIDGRKVIIKGKCEFNGEILTECESLFINMDASND